MSKIRVVLIEDHDLTRFTTKLVLLRSGLVEVIGEAASASVGLDLLRQCQPDVGIIDIDLPDMNGIELVQQFQALRSPKAQTRLLILTLHETSECMQAAIAAGANSYCIKTSSSNDLITALQMTHQGNSWIDPKLSPALHSQLMPLPT